MWVFQFLLFWSHIIHGPCHISKIIITTECPSRKKNHKLPDHHLSILAAAEDAGCLSSSICGKLATECLSYPREGDRRVSNAAISACPAASSCQPCRPHYRHASAPVPQLVLPHWKHEEESDLFSTQSSDSSLLNILSCGKMAHWHPINF